MNTGGGHIHSCHLSRLPEVVYNSQPRPHRPQHEQLGHSATAPQQALACTRAAHPKASIACNSSSSSSSSGSNGSVPLHAGSDAGMDPSSALTPPPVPADAFSSISEALEDIRLGRPVVVVDDENRENEGDLIYAGDRMSTEQMAFMVEHTSGVVCLAMEGSDLDRLQLPLMVNSEANEEAMYTAFTITADYRHGTTTGISAFDRALTVRELSNPGCPPADFKRPGHIFPLRYHPGGVLVRPGHTEAGVDLARLAGCYPSGCLSEIVDRRDGSMARLMQLLEFAKQHGLKCITIAQLIRHRLQHEEVVQEVSQAPVSLPLSGYLTPQKFRCTMRVFRCKLSGQEHLVISNGVLSGASDVLLQLQHGNVFADLISNLAIDPSSRLQASFNKLAAHDGLIIYCSGRRNSWKGAAEQLASPSAASTASPDASSVHAARENGIIAAILRKLKVHSVRLQSSASDQMHTSLTSLGVVVTSASSSNHLGQDVPDQGHLSTSELDDLQVPQLRSEVNSAALVTSLTSSAQNGCSAA